MVISLSASILFLSEVTREIASGKAPCMGPSSYRNSTFLSHAQTLVLLLAKHALCIRSPYVISREYVTARGVWSDIKLLSPRLVLAALPGGLTTLTPGCIYVASCVATIDHEHSFTPPYKQTARYILALILGKSSVPQQIATDVMHTACLKRITRVCPNCWDIIPTKS